LPVSNKDQNQPYVKPVNRNKSFSERLDPLLGIEDEHFYAITIYIALLQLTVQQNHTTPTVFEKYCTQKLCSH